MTAERDNAGKPELHYILTMPRTMEALSAVLTEGAKKYEYLNYLKGGKPDQEYWDSALRHLRDAGRYIVSQDQKDLYDKETGCHHVAHAIWNLAMLLDLNWTDLPIKIEPPVLDDIVPEKWIEMDKDLMDDMVKGKISEKQAMRLQRKRYEATLDWRISDAH